MIKYQIYNYSQANNIASLVLHCYGLNKSNRKEDILTVAIIILSQVK